MKMSSINIINGSDKHKILELVCECECEQTSAEIRNSCMKVHKYMKPGSVQSTVSHLAQGGLLDIAVHEGSSKRRYRISDDGISELFRLLNMEPHSPYPGNLKDAVIEVLRKIGNYATAKHISDVLGLPNSSAVTHVLTRLVSDNVATRGTNGVVNTYTIVPNPYMAVPTTQGDKKNWSHYGDDVYPRILEALENIDDYATALFIADKMDLPHTQTGGIGSRLMHLAADGVVVKRVVGNKNEYILANKQDTIGVGGVDECMGQTHGFDITPDVRKLSEPNGDDEIHINNHETLFTSSPSIKDDFEETDLENRIDKLVSIGKSTHNIAWECFVALQPMVDECEKIELSKEEDDLKERGPLLYSEYEKIKMENRELKEQLQMKESNDMVKRFADEQACIRGTHVNMRK